MEACRALQTGCICTCHVSGRHGPLLSQQYEKSPALVADLSQNLDRAAVRTDGALPTVTPGSHLVLREAGRVVTPIEKILVHGFPVHRMVFPAQVTDAELASTGGNTMHVHVVAVALMLATSMVDWTLLQPMTAKRVPAAGQLSKAPRPQVPRCKAPGHRKGRLPKPEQKSLPQKSHLKVRQVRRLVSQAVGVCLSVSSRERSLLFTDADYDCRVHVWTRPTSCSCLQLAGSRQR